VLPHADAGVGRPEVDPDGRTLALRHLLRFARRGLLASGGGRKLDWNNALLALLGAICLRAL
jgi:hypothetical protein